MAVKRITGPTSSEPNQIPAQTSTPMRIGVEKPFVDNPFMKASSRKKRLKLFLWGDTGTGKTTLALQFPKPVVIDMEGSTDLYGDKFEFDVMHTANADDAFRAVDWLSRNPGKYQTVVIDPITIFWDALQKKWSDIFLSRNTQSKGFKYEFYEMQPKDWQTVKAEFKEFIRMLDELDMIVVVTSREKPKYRDGAYMQIIGETFDGDKSLPYMFDVVVRLRSDASGKHFAEAVKDRSNTLPKTPFEVSFEHFKPFV